MTFLHFYLKPLQQKLKKDIEYQFDKKDQIQIQKVKLLCKNLPKLYFPDENKKFTYIIESDASEKSYGGILKYRYDDTTIEHHCRYYSGTFNNTEIVCLNTAAGTSKQVSDKQHKNANLNQLFEKSFTQRTPRHMSIEPQTSTYADSLQNQNEKKTYNYITRSLLVL